MATAIFGKGVFSHYDPTSAGQVVKNAFPLVTVYPWIQNVTPHSVQPTPRSWTPTQTQRVAPYERGRWFREGPILSTGVAAQAREASPMASATGTSCPTCSAAAKTGRRS
jgi:hypothetical protein